MTDIDCDGILSGQQPQKHAQSTMQQQQHIVNPFFRSIANQSTDFKSASDNNNIRTNFTGNVCIGNGAANERNNICSDTQIETQPISIGMDLESISIKNPSPAQCTAWDGEWNGGAIALNAGVYKTNGPSNIHAAVQQLPSDVFGFMPPIETQYITTCK